MNSTRRTITLLVSHLVFGKDKVPLEILGIIGTVTEINGQ